jgi:RNA polymerase sigma-70 factor (ECF subfamily)
MDLTQRQTLSEKKQIVRLVRAAQQGDRQALGELFHRYERAVYLAALRRLGNDAEAQDLCQEVFIQAVRKIGQLENPLCFGGWLQRIAHRMAINRAVRRGPVLAASDQNLETNCVEHRTPLGDVLTRERCDQIHAGLNRLADLDRSTLEAFYFGGRSIIEMSDEFDAPVGTIKRRLHVARKRLAEELEALAPA